MLKCSYSATQMGYLEQSMMQIGIVSLTATNNGISSTVVYGVRANVVGFGTTTAGIGTIASF